MISGTDLIEQAAKIAAQAHAGQMRKGDDTPYIVHPFMVAMLLQKNGFSDTCIAAALVHDVLEDTDYGTDALREALGDEVLAIVLTLTEDKSLPWEERKKKYIESVRNGSEEAKAVSIADKIHNLKSLLTMHAQEGAGIWKVFNRGKEQKLWFEEAMLTMFQEAWQHELVGEYEQLIEQMKTLD